jgi:protein phosphatase
MENSVKVESFGMTNLGMVRAVNQDSYLIDDDANMYIVADGMGGHAGGEIASQICVKEISKYIRAMGSSETSDNKIFGNLYKAINIASAKIYERGLEEPNLKGMGTTASVLKIIGKRAYMGHVGDSRIYLIRSGFIYRLTTDHSLVGEQVRAGLITEEEASTHKLRNIITRSVGYQESEEVDTEVLDLANDDLLILCSDGLHGKVDEREIAKLCCEKNVKAVTHLIDMANSRGGEDNITVIVLNIKL